LASLLRDNRSIADNKGDNSACHVEKSADVTATVPSMQKLPCLACSAFVLKKRPHLDPSAPLGFLVAGSRVKDGGSGIEFETKLQLCVLHDEVCCHCSRPKIEMFSTLPSFWRSKKPASVATSANLNQRTFPIHSLGHLSSFRAAATHLVLQKREPPRMMTVSHWSKV
jgi:hypothetical protein